MWRGEGPVTQGMLDWPIYELLQRVAREQRTTTYGDIAPLAGLDMESPADRDRMRELLGKISTYEHQNKRPMLTAVVVHKQDGRPGDGFFELARHLGLMAKGGDREEFFVRELDRVHKHWKLEGQGGTAGMGRVKEGRGAFLPNAAEHYVVAELLRRDILADRTPRNFPDFDVLATAGHRAANIRVKVRSEEAKDWTWQARADRTVFRDLAEEGDFTVLVHLEGRDVPARYWVVPTAELDRKLREGFAAWVNTPGQKGPHDPSSKMRRFPTNDEERRWLEPFAGRWDLILAALGRGKRG